MATMTMTMIDRVEDALAQLWLQFDHTGDDLFQEEIERVLDTFPQPEGSIGALRTIRLAHDLFRRVHTANSIMTLGRTWRPLAGCPHCYTPGMEVE